MTALKPLDIIGVPTDLGANIRGSNMGPSAIRISELHRKLKALNYLVNDLGDLHIPIQETISASDQSEKFENIIIKTAEDLAEVVKKSLTDGHIPITIGGDHSLALGSIAGVQKFYSEQNKKVGLIWVDAHADLNTHETSPSGNIHGMPLAAIIGLGSDKLKNIAGSSPKVLPQNVALIGIRTVDGLEKDICRKSGIKYYTMREIDERGMSAIAKEAINVASKGTDVIHVSFDIDAIDPLYAPGVSTPETGGLSYREAHLLLEIVADSNKLSSLDMVELNPIQDINNKTSHLAVELIQSALGKSII